MKFDDVYLMVEILLVAAAIAFFLAFATFIAALIFLFQVRERLKALGRPPHVLRDQNGRPYRERI
jgi:hypothetical protein